MNIQNLDKQTEKYKKVTNRSLKVEEYSNCNILEGLNSRLDEQKKDQWFVKTGQRNSHKHSSIRKKIRVRVRVRVRVKTKELLKVKIT